MKAMFIREERQIIRERDTRSRIFRAYFEILPAILILLFGLTWSNWALARRPTAFVPAHPDSVVERLPKGFAALEPVAQGRENQSMDGMLERIGGLLAVAAETGDMRLVSRADALLRSFPGSPRNPKVLRLRAYSAQHKHEFAQAAELLDALILAAPRDGEARLARAGINLVRGRLMDARRDCAALALGLDLGDGLLCAAALLSRTGEHAHASRLIDLWLNQSSVQDKSRRFALVMRAESASRGGDPAADRWFQKALGAAPDDVRTLAAYARHLRRRGRPVEVERLLENAARTDALGLQRALAARKSGIGNSEALTEALARRYALTHAAGGQPELRDEAEFQLSLRQHPKAALALALRNFNEQRDYEDVEILVRAANAAGQPDALGPLRSWAKSEGVPLSETSSGTKQKAP